MSKFLKVILVIITICLVTTVVLVAIATYETTRTQTITCKWIAPLKTNYEMCTNGKVIEK